MTEAPNPISEQKEENKDDKNINEQKDNNSNVPDLQQKSDENKNLEDQQKEIGDKLINGEKNDADNSKPEENQNQDPEKIENEDDKKPPEDTEKETENKPPDEPEKVAENKPPEDTEKETENKPPEDTEKVAENKPPDEPEDNSQAQIFNLRDFIEQDEEKKRQVEMKFRMFVDPLFQSKPSKEIKKEHPDTEKAKLTIKTENLQTNNKVCSPPKSPNRRSPRKNQKEVVRYDRNVFYQSDDSFKEQRSCPSSPSEKIELTITLNDIGLEGLDSSTPDKAENLRKEGMEKEKERKLKENENEKNVKAIKKPTVPVRYSPRRRLIQSKADSSKPANNNNDLNKTTNNSVTNPPKSSNSPSQTVNTKKPLFAIPFSLLSDSDS